MSRFSKRGITLLLFLLLTTTVFAQTGETPSTTPAATPPTTSPSTSSTTPATSPETAPAEESAALSLARDNSKGYDWLVDQVKTTTPPHEEQILSILALLSQGGREKDVTALVQRLQENQDDQEACWPQGDCKVLDTALAYLALVKTGDSKTKPIQDWLKTSLIAGLRTSGEWRIQLETAKDGVCTLSWGTKKKEFTLEKGEIKNSAKKYYITLSDLQDSSLTSTPNQKINVDCSALATDLSGSDIVISLLYAKTPAELYLLQSSSGPTSTLTLANGCFGQEQTTSRCDYLTTLKTTWALSESGEKLLDWGTYTYLESNLAGDDLQKAYLVRSLLLDGTLSTTSFANNLAATQRAGDGSWKNGDILTTAVASLALSRSSEHQPQVDNSKLFLERKQDSDGSWNSDIETTAWALLALKGDLPTGFVSTSGRIPISGVDGRSKETICDDTLDNDNDAFPDCGDKDCLEDSSCRCENGVADTGELGIDCGGTCTDACKDGAETPATDLEDECTSDTDCAKGESCTSGTCTEDIDTSEEGCTTDDDCSADQTCENSSCVVKEEGNLGMILLIIFIVLFLGGGAYFYLAYIRTGKVTLFKKDKGVSFDEFKQTLDRPTRPTRPSTPPPRQAMRAPPKKSIEDEELEKSLREAEKLLKQ